jgi:uncharacterized protein YidB (DUF937 family)
LLKETADWLGMPAEDLGRELRSGKSLREVAEARGKSKQELTTFLTDLVKQRLDKAVQEGKLTQPQADQMLQRFRDNVDQLVERKHTPAAPRRPQRSGGSA